MTVPALPSWLGKVYLLSVMALLHLAGLEMLPPVIVTDSRAQLVTLIFNYGLVRATNKAL